jgi:hypothetical protein
MKLFLILNLIILIFFSSLNSNLKEPLDIYLSYNSYSFNFDYFFFENQENKNYSFNQNVFIEISGKMYSLKMKNKKILYNSKNIFDINLKNNSMTIEKNPNFEIFWTNLKFYKKFFKILEKKEDQYFIYYTLLSTDKSFDLKIFIILDKIKKFIKEIKIIEKNQFLHVFQIQNFKLEKNKSKDYFTPNLYNFKKIEKLN